uniref:Scaffolding protein n=1 Tax=viral metagenome TaxID=1070528 RepID=A0A6M3IPX7_9ZZZZ
MQLVDQTVQDKVQETPPDAPQKGSETPKEETKYTEKQWRDMQSKIRKAESERFSNLQEKYAKAESDMLALQSQLDDKTAIEETLKGQIADYHSQIEEGLTDDGKPMFTKLQKDIIGLRERLARQTLEFQKRESELSKYKDTDRQNEATKLADKYGVNLDDLLGFKDVKEMKAYALDNFDPSKLAQPQVEIKSEDEGKLPRVETPVTTGELSDAAFWKRYGGGAATSPEDDKRAQAIYKKATGG